MDDSISFSLWLLALMLILYFSVFIGFTDGLLIPVVLLFGGLLLQIAIAKKIPQDEYTSFNEGAQLGKYTLLALGGMFLASLVVPAIFQPPKYEIFKALSIWDAALYAGLYAITEERFFRGGFLTFLLWKFKERKWIVIVSSAAVFYIYHFAVYGYSTVTLTWVLLTGGILTYITLKTKRLSSSTLAHLFNNLLSSVMSVLGGG